MAGNSKELSEATVSRTLGSTDTIFEDSGTVGESNGGIDKNKTPWVDLFKPKYGNSDDILHLNFYEPVNGGAVIQDSELLVFKEQWAFALLGWFAGRFPGITAVQALVDSWEIPCKWYTQPNDHVLFRFNSEEDRCKILSHNTFTLYGKPLFLKSLPERFHLENNDFSTLPIWVQFPSLPVEFWGPVALSKIASCIGKPLWSDDKTKVLKKGGYARVLVEIDTSSHPLETIPVSTPSGYSFSQDVYYELPPCFCTKCCSNDHYKEECTGKRKYPRRGRKFNHSKGKRGGSRKSRSKSKASKEHSGGQLSTPPPLDNTNQTDDLEDLSTAAPCVPSPTSADDVLNTDMAAPSLENGGLEAIPSEPTGHEVVPIVPVRDGEEEPPTDVKPTEPASPSTGGTDVLSEISPLGSNTSRGKNVLKEIIAEVFDKATAAKKKKKATKAGGQGMVLSLKAGGASRNSKGTLGYKGALLSPSTDKGNSNAVESQRNLTPLPLKDKVTARGGGRRQPTSVVK